MKRNLVMMMMMIRARMMAIRIRTRMIIRRKRKRYLFMKKRVVCQALASSLQCKLCLYRQDGYIF
jgi:hypothetical protein